MVAAQQYLSYFQGRVQEWSCADQRHLRNIIPENRLRIYNVREVIHTMADTGSVLELRPKFGLGMVTAFIRIEGRPHRRAGQQSRTSLRRHRQRRLRQGRPASCSSAMPSTYRRGAVRYTRHDGGPPRSRRPPWCAIAAGCSLPAPISPCPHVTIVLRKAYGLGAQAMAGGSFKEPFAAVAWPTGEFGGMGLEGQVKLGFRNELAAIEDPQERIDRYDDLVAAAYERGKAFECRHVVCRGRRDRSGGLAPLGGGCL